MTNRTGEILVGGALIWIGWVSVTINDTSKATAVMLAKQDAADKQRSAIVEYMKDPNLETYKGLILSSAEVDSEKKGKNVSLRWEITHESGQDEGVSGLNAGRGDRTL